MCEPLRGKGMVDDQTRAYLELRWFKKDGTEYKSDKINFDGDYNAYTPNDELLESRYFDEDGAEVKQTIFSVGDVKSAVEFYKKYRDEPDQLKYNQPKVWSKWEIYYVGNFKPPQMFNNWLFDYCFKDVI